MQQLNSIACVVLYTAVQASGGHNRCAVEYRRENSPPERHGSSTYTFRAVTPLGPHGRGTITTPEAATYMQAFYKSNLTSKSSIWALSEANVCGQKCYWHCRRKHRTSKVSLIPSRQTSQFQADKPKLYSAHRSRNGRAQLSTATKSYLYIALTLATKEFFQLSNIHLLLPTGPSNPTQR